MQDKKSLSIAMLIDGRPQAFVDFFHLTHFPGGRAEQQEELPQNSLLFLKTQLVKADIARQSHQVEEVYGAYKLLAKYFAQLGRLQTAEFFFKQCLHFSREAAWLPGELEFLDLASSGATSGGDKGAEGVATTTLAHCLQARASLGVGKPGGPEQSGPAVASCSLGILYYAQGAFPRAVSLFERFFEVARGLPDKRMADVARINLGVARAAVNSQ
ncbi:uncharacterized protein HaLaN_09733 [Haematococcus lacustris]|uniref:Tetratricopeptide repeat protein 29 n=1 Tax=Haematococcus lacustris TaxID=44745 RepID=A0A699YU81_HAELA|nr:uncharacterized protein HaLaN_09733 [Haematococcus lacustris]